MVLFRSIKRNVILKVRNVWTSPFFYHLPFDQQGPSSIILIEGDREREQAERKEKEGLETTRKV